MNFYVEDEFYDKHEAKIENEALSGWDDIDDFDIKPLSKTPIAEELKVYKLAYELALEELSAEAGVDYRHKNLLAQAEHEIKIGLK